MAALCRPSNGRLGQSNPFVGNEIRDPNQLRSLFDRLKFDLWRIRPKKQEVVMFWLPGNLATDEIKQALVNLDLDSLDTVAKEER